MAQNQNDSSMTSVLIIVLILIVGFVIKAFLGNEIMHVFLQFKMLIVKGYLSVFSTDGLKDAYDKIDIYTPKEWNYSAYAALSGDLRFYISIPLLLILLPYGYKVYKKNPLNKYKRVFNRQSLCDSEVKIWPWIAPVIRLDIISMPINEGVWAMSETPVAFCKKYNLLNDKNEVQREKAKKVLISQLGPLWTGIENLKIHEKAMLACFLAQLNDSQSKAIKALSLMSSTIANGNIDYSFVDDYIKKYAYTEKSERILNKNAYVYNVIATVFEECKLEGKIPPSYFLWLKSIDRRLFYTLHCVGRKLPFVEVSGIFGHGLAEKVINRKCINPYVEKGIDGIKEALTHVKM